MRLLATADRNHSSVYGIQSIKLLYVPSLDIQICFYTEMRHRSGFVTSFGRTWRFLYRLCFSLSLLYRLCFAISVWISVLITVLVCILVIFFPFGCMPVLFKRSSFYAGFDHHTRFCTGYVLQFRFEYRFCPGQSRTKKLSYLVPGQNFHDLIVWS